MNNRHWWRALFLRRAIVGILILIQLFFLAYMFFDTSEQVAWLGYFINAISFVLALHVINRRVKSGYRMVWVVLILFSPFVGIPFYILHGLQTGSDRMNRRIADIRYRSTPALNLPPSCFEEAQKFCKKQLPGLNYLQQYAGFPVCKHTHTSFFSPGEIFFEAMLLDLDRAENYIFLEYFILHEGEMWSKIEQILRRKVASGVEVRVMYDDMGCFLSLRSGFAAYLESIGIKAAVFNPFSPFVSTIQNNRDHRKICAIDGKVAYTGGINIGDEYINRIDRLGHWKDSALRLEGHAAWSLTVIFLQQWELTRRQKEEYFRFYPWHTEECEIESSGYVLPYADSPVDDDNVGEHVYLQIINAARHYLYICSPYVIVDDSLVSALSLASKSGVDVRIITPDRADKKIVHFTTQSYYRQLMNSGVRIFQYTGGFMHSKIFVSDDVVATVGTTNLDYRSLYLNFECGVWMYKTDSVKEVKSDFLTTLAVCHEIRAEDCHCRGLRRFAQEMARLLAPLM